MININYSFAKQRVTSTFILMYLALGSFVVILGCNKEPADLQKAIPRVKVFTVGDIATGQSRRISGKVQASDKSILSFGVGGKVIEVIVKKGQVVAKGQLLAKLDEEPLEISLKEARARLSSIRAKFVEAQALYDRTNKLFQARAVSRNDLDAATATLGSLSGDVKGAQNSLRKAELDLERGKLIAPFSGQVVDVSIDPFQEVMPGEPAVVVQVEGTLEVEVRVPETLIRDVDYGQLVEASFPTAPDLKIPGIVTSIGAEAEAGNAFSVLVSLPAGNENLRAGMTASITFNFSDYLDGKTAYLIPLSAIDIGAGESKTKETKLTEETQKKLAQVFVFDPVAKQANSRKIVVGELRGNEVEVFDGLSPGEQIVSTGVALIRDGLKAEVWEQS